MRASSANLCATALLAVVCLGCQGDATAQVEPSEGASEEQGDEAYEPPPGGARRLLAYQYINTVRHVLGDAAAEVAAPPADPILHGYASIAAAQLAVPVDTVELYERSALDVAAEAVAAPETLAKLAPCVLDAREAPCYETVAAELGHVLWRRPLSAAELASVVELALEGRARGRGGFDAGLRYALVRLLLSPHFLYVSELGEPEPDSDSGDPERRRLTGPEAVTRLSLLLLGRSPSLTLLESAEAGNYDSVGALEDLARAMIDDPSAPEALANFFAEYLALADIPAKDSERFPLYSEALVDSMLEETERLLEDVIWAQDADFRQFLEADYTFVDARLAALYGVPAPPEGEWQRVTLPPAQGRAGFISHASLLARNAHAGGNSTTRRGQYIQDRLLCFSVPPPPPELNPEIPPVPEDSPMTLRELMELTHLSEEGCATCHLHMDPIGFVLESYDAIGAWRDVDASGLPIDPVVEIEGWGTLTDATELAASLTMDPRLGRCIVNNLVRFGRGSLEQPETEGAELDALYAAFEASNYRFKAMLVRFVTSDLFLQVGAPR